MKTIPGKATFCVKYIIYGSIKLHTFHMNKFQELHALLWWLFVYLPFHLLVFLLVLFAAVYFPSSTSSLLIVPVSPPGTCGPERVKAASLWLPMHTIVYFPSSTSSLLIVLVPPPPPPPAPVVLKGLKQQVFGCPCILLFQAAITYNLIVSSITLI